MGPPKKAGLIPYNPFPRGLPLTIPENVCYSAICPLKLGQTAETIVSTLLCEFGLEAEPMVQTSCYEQVKHVFPLKERPPVGSSMSAEPSSSHSLLNRWEKRISHSSSSGENNLLAHEGSSLLSKWESKHCIFKSKSPDRLKDLELLACAHVPDPCEIQRLANHIMLSVIKELITFRPKDSLASLPTWRQELIWSESKWLQERIWRSMYLPPPSRKTSSCLDLFWEPLTQAVVCSLVLSISNPSMRENAQERNDLFEGSLSMYCTVDACCPNMG
ncbi:uncharacterized protein LOC128336044 [Hemicordylus capensis]|uniref:uncharacterized protein LOC128336044 n=1 Tax=Hemicordylus capensis TaxID=884348 RepID=UPI002303414C|nr:uncharacterized protein LOC128336044 [Hemicordylus capensis]